jgi:hypothetical protein
MMSNEEWERKMEFLLNNQAQFNVDMSRLEAAQAASEKRLDRISESLSSYATILCENFKITDSRILALTESHRRTDTKIQELTVKVQELTDSQKLTDEQLRKFIIKVDRLTGEDQNGLQN